MKNTPIPQSCKTAVSGSLFDIIEDNYEMGLELEKFVRERIYRFLLNQYDLELTFDEWVRLNYR